MGEKRVRAVVNAKDSTGLKKQKLDDVKAPALETDGAVPQQRQQSLGQNLGKAAGEAPKLTSFIHIPVFATYL